MGLRHFLNARGETRGLGALLSRAATAISGVAPHMLHRFTTIIHKGSCIYINTAFLIATKGLFSFCPTM